jgi:hypothetical protein
MANRTDNALVRQSIDEIVQGPYAHGLVGAYFDPSRGFARATFDGLDSDSLLTENPHDHFTVDDIAATSLLDVRFGPTALRALLSDPTLQRALAAVPDQLSLWDADEPALAAATTLWKLVRDIEGVGRTRASKLMARKRPHLIPIVDSVIANALHLGDQTWRPLAECLRDPLLRQDLEGLRPQRVSKDISTLRILDVATWMSHSRSRAAVMVQNELGAPEARTLPRRRSA